jgi:hypothetical protein
MFSPNTGVIGNILLMETVRHNQCRPADRLRRTNVGSKRFYGI